MKAFARTDIGKQRSENQDYVFCSTIAVGTFQNLFIVADGMGGHNAGDYASRFCVEEFTRRVEEGGAETVIGKMTEAIEGTNRQLIKKASERAEFEGMGTTFVAATVEAGTMYVVNIGDSRLYLIGEDIMQITEDHSLVAEMVRNGELKKEEARYHPNKNVVTRAMSASGLVIPDFFEVDVKEGDIVMLCSDGLTTMLEDSEIFSIVKKAGTDIEAMANALVDKANNSGGRDNISVVLINI